MIKQTCLFIFCVVALIACGGGSGGSSPTPSQVAPPPPPAPVSTQAPTTKGAGISFQENQTGEKQYNILIVRGEFSDAKTNLSNAQWNDQWMSEVTELQRYLTLYGYGRVNISVQTSSAIEFSQGQSAGFNLSDLANLFQSGYREIAQNSSDDDIAKLDNADVVIYSYPSIPHDQAGGAFGLEGEMWMPGQLFTGGVIHEFGHALGMPHSQGIEGVAFGASARQYKIVTNAETEGYDGLHMIGSDGGQRTGFFAPYPLIFSYEADILPGEHYRKITQNGTYRLIDFEVPTLPDGGEDLLYEIEVDNQSYFLSYSPKMSERWVSFDPTGFNTGVIVHLRRTNNDRLALLDFTPNSYRKDRVFSKADHDQQLFRDFRDGAFCLSGRASPLLKVTLAIAPLPYLLFLKGKKTV